MELWIRSQDKLKLLKANNITIKFETEEVLMSTYHTILIYNDDEVIGTYETQQRALEVLDEIQNYIIELDKAIIYSQTSTEDYSNVYEMPKE